MFPYDYLLHSDIGKSPNQTSVMFDCAVTDNDSFFSSCLFTFGFYYVLPLLIIGLSYSRILLHVRRSSCKMSKQLVSNDVILIIWIIFHVVGWNTSIDEMQKSSSTTYAIRFNFSICTLLVTNSYFGIIKLFTISIKYICFKPSRNVNHCSRYCTWFILF
jgi:hypothetical protein